MDWAGVFGASALVPLFAATIRLTVPTALAALGDAVSQRAGVLNLGLEGVMLAGAFGGFMGAHLAGSATIGIATGAMSGMVVALIIAAFVVHLRCDPIVAGVSIVLAVEGLTAFLLDDLYGDQSAPPTVPRLPSIRLPLLEKIPGAGEVLFRLDALGYAVPIAAIGTGLLIRRTGFGLRIRAAGCDENAAGALAVPVNSTRTAALLLSGAITGMGGAVLVVSQVGLFSVNMTAGRGFLAIAIVLIGRMRPFPIMAGALAFGFLDALQFRIQLVSGGTASPVPFELFQALPYVATVLVVAGAGVISVRRQALTAASLLAVEDL